MPAHSARRPLGAVPVLRGISPIAFVLLNRAPGDPARVPAGPQALPNLLGGVVVERVTNWPGIGFQACIALKGPDVPLVMGTVMMAGSFAALVNLLVDLAMAPLDSPE